MSDTAEYLARIRDYAQGKDPLELQKQAPAVLAEMIAKASDEQLTTRPAKDKWSIGEILAHLAEDEIATAWRYRQMVEHTGLQLAGFDQDMWARSGRLWFPCAPRVARIVPIASQREPTIPKAHHARTVGMLWNSCRTGPHYGQGIGRPYGGPRCQSHRANPQNYRMTRPSKVWRNSFRVSRIVQQFRKCPVVAHEVHIGSICMMLRVFRQIDSATRGCPFLRGIACILRKFKSACKNDTSDRSSQTFEQGCSRV